MSTLVFAQHTWFKIYDLIPGAPVVGQADTEGAYFMVSRDTSYYATIFAGYGFSQIATQSMVIEINQEGDIVWASPIEYPASATHELIYYYVRDLVVANDGSLYVLTHGPDSTGKFSALVNKFSSKGELKWYKGVSFKDFPVSTDAALHGLCLNTDSLSVTVSGFSEENFPNGKFAVSKLDSSGNTIWQHLISPPNLNTDWNIPMVWMPNGSLKIALDDGLITNYSDFSCSLDSLGAVEYWKKHYYGCKAIDMQYHPTGNLVYLSQDEEFFPERGGMRVQMLTPELDTVWSRRYIDTEFPYLYLESGNPMNLSISRSGKILAIGQNTNNCALVCYSPNGDQLWSREVALEGYQKPRFNFGIWAPDGGILLDGVISGDNGLDSYSQCFFMKLDSLGCRQPGCAQTVFTSTDDLSKHNDVFDGDLRFSPNPAADFVQIEQPEKAVSARAELRFSNVLGETIFQTPFSNPKTTVRTADWPAGIYLVQLFEHGALKKAARLIVVH